MIEKWKPVVGFERLYEVSNYGRIKSLVTARLMKPKANSKYGEVKLRKNGRSIMKYVHRAVLEAFVGICPANLECRHLDGNRRNCELNNLTWGTRLQNMRDSIRHGTFSRGTKHYEAIKAGGGVRGSDGRWRRR